MGEKLHFEDKKKILEDAAIPIPLKAEKLIGKKLIAVLRYGSHDEPILFFEDNTALLQLYHQICDSSAYEDVEKERECGGCFFGLDLTDYLSAIIEGEIPEPETPAEVEMQSYLLKIQLSAKKVKDKISAIEEEEQKQATEQSERKTLEMLSKKYNK